MVIYHNHKRKNYRIFLFSFPFLIQTNLLVQAADYTTNKKADYTTNKKKGITRQIASALRTNKFTDFNKQYA
ncbi:hypothetical protein VN0011_04250 [Helicobacter pylori]